MSLLASRYPFPFLGNQNLVARAPAQSPTRDRLIRQESHFEPKSVRWCGWLNAGDAGTSKWVAEKLICSNTIQKTLTITSSWVPGS